MHSLLISNPVITRMKNALGEKSAYFRLAYNIFSLLTLMAVIAYQLSLSEEVLFSWPGPWKILKLGLYLAAFILFYGGYRVYDIDYVLGIKQVHEMRQEKKAESVPFSTSGILEYVRHPWYSGAILLVWAFGPITDVSLVTKIILTVYIILGTLLEEQKLIQELGTPYVEYRKRVPMLVPRIKREQ